MPDSEPKNLYDAIFAFDAGVNAGVAPLLLARNQLANASNTTVRGSFVKPRPPFFKLTFDQDSFDLLASAFAEGPFQGGTYYKPDNDDECFVIQVAGRLFKITPDSSDYTAVAEEVTAAGDPNPPNDLQVWMWQSEKWVIVQNGSLNPLFFDGATTIRSNYATPVDFSTTTTADFIIPAVAATVVVAFTSVADVDQGDIITVQRPSPLLSYGTYQVQSIAGLNVTLLNLTSGPVGATVSSGANLLWKHLGTQLPPGRMGTYGLGRNWLSLPDARQFVASDLVGGSSGTVAENYRDAVLYITENLYLAGGGNFAVPGSVGDIKAMRFTATLDVSLGQGPLQVFTPTSVFSCQAPLDRETWQDVTNPILTQSLISNGGLSQNATIPANGDTIFRSVDGIRSLILARRDFDTWGNVPISREVEPQLEKDSSDLLGFSSAIIFDNRMLMTCLPVLHSRGVYWRGLIPLNFDPISTLRGKAPSVYDGTLWSGLNVFQLFTGQFRNVDRAYAITFNAFKTELELWEIQKSSTAETLDNGKDRITWVADTAFLDFGQRDPRTRELKQLADGEIYIDELSGEVDFQVFYKPDEGCWTHWFSWRECATIGRSGKKQFRPRMGLGEPRVDDCDATTNRPNRNAYGFQVRFVITGHCRLLGARFRTFVLPEPQFAPQSCTPICVDQTVTF